MDAEIATLSFSFVDHAADLLARAFFDTPAWVWALPDAQRRERVLQWFFRAATYYAFRHGETHVTAGELRGVALVLPPERPLLDGAALARAGLWQMPLRAGLRGFARFRAQGRVLDERHARDVDSRHVYVWQIGVHPSHHRRGIGSALLGAVAARADRAGVPIYLDTTEERNLAFYRHHGFEVVYDGEFPRGGCRVWTLVRRAQSGAPVTSA